MLDAAQIEREGLAPQARIVSETLSPSEMAAAFNRADLFVSCPETDFLASTILEGMACGCVPILADLPYYRSRIEDGAHGFYFTDRAPESLAATIENAFSNPERLNDIRLRIASEAPEKDDWAKCARRMEEIYESLVRS